jgi:8-oxo-dGTP pyrophosphatase MutT (NUDIX family)
MHNERFIGGFAGEEKNAGGAFTAAGFTALAIRHGTPLAQAGWMAAQPLAFGIDAGYAVDDNGQAIDRLTLDAAFSGMDWRTCAVLVPVVAREPEATLLLTLRTSHLKSHAGQISFPGGKVEKGDATPVEAALREAREEIGLGADYVTPLSLLDLHKTGTGYRIIPVLAQIAPDFTARPDPSEVAEVFEVPLSFLMAEDNHQQHFLTYKGRRILFHAMAYGDRFIWGATAAIIRNLHQRLYAS